MSERELIAWFRAHRGTAPDDVLIDSGDDAALVRVKGGSVLFKVDGVIDGVHFKLRKTTPEQVGHKALARTLSDIAAMGGTPTYALAALMLPKKGAGALAKRIFLGMERTARRYGVTIVGGDVATHPGKLAITVSLLGEMRGAKPVLRSGARPGDRLYVTGDLGGSIQGKHLVFEPRLAEGRRFARTPGVHAMIDISDGLVIDLDSMCRASGVGADLERIPVTRGCMLEQALYDGEDYELLVASSKPIPAIEIGRMTKEPGIRWHGQRLKVEGYDHLRS